MKTKIIVIALVLVALIAFNFYFPFKDYLQDAVEFCEQQESWGSVLFFLLFVICGICFIPVSPLIMVAGTIYGFGLGYLLVVAAAMTSVIATYAIGKKLWPEYVEKLRHRNPHFEAVFEAISHHGGFLVFLIRLNPFLPYSLINYLFTIPKLDYKRYLLGSLIGMTPDIFLYLYIGRMGRGWLDEEGFSRWSWLILGFALATTIAAVLYIKRLLSEAARSKNELRSKPI